MNQVLGPQIMGESVLVYLDDILVFSKTPEEHETHLRCVLERLAKHQLFAKRSKCEFGLRQVEFLGHLVGGDGIRVDPAKVAAIREWPTPACVKDIQSFLGLANYYNRFVKDFAAVSAPMANLL